MATHTLPRTHAHTGMVYYEAFLRHDDDLIQDFLIAIAEPVSRLESVLGLGWVRPRVRVRVRVRFRA